MSHSTNTRQLQSIGNDDVYAGKTRCTDEQWEDTIALIAPLLVGWKI